MKNGRRYFLISWMILTTRAVWAFMPGPDIIRECPKCKAFLEQRTMMSGNTFGAKYWTDGKMEAPMYLERPWLVKCPKCQTLFWVDEANELGRKTWGEESAEWPGSVPPDKPSEADYLQMVDEGNLPHPKELYVRRNAWWLVNDVLRTNRTATVGFSPPQEKNLLALANLLDEKEPPQLIMMAEIYREVGRFEECIRLLSDPLPEQYAEVGDYVKKLAEQKFRRLRALPQTEK